MTQIGLFEMRLTDVQMTCDT